MSSAAKITVAVLRLRAEKTVVVTGPGGTKQIVALSLRRIVWFILVQACRMGVAVSLGYGGTRFLVATVGLNDMLLNTAGLAFVLDFVVLRALMIP